MPIEKCPSCGSRDIDFDDCDIQGVLMVQDCECEDCGHRFERVWSFVETRERS